MPWNGYNFEDSILICERVVADDRYTSIHIEELIGGGARHQARAGGNHARHLQPGARRSSARLDESGIVYIGAEVEAGDVLVGKVTPKGETQLTPEEKLLRAIFGEKASDVKDTSLRVPSGMTGTVIDVQVFTREGIERDKRAQQIIDDELKRLSPGPQRPAAHRRGRRLRAHRAAAPGQGRPTAARSKIAKGTRITKDYLECARALPLVRHPPRRRGRRGAARGAEGLARAQTRMQFDQCLRGEEEEADPGRRAAARACRRWSRCTWPSSAACSRATRWRAATATRAWCRKIVPVEDMPYMADGTPVDIVLNPLGVPSRMNVGQILEVHLGWAAKGLGAAHRRDAQGPGHRRRAGAQVPAQDLQQHPASREDDRRASTTTRSLELAEQPERRRAVRDAGVRRRVEREIRRCSSGMPGGRRRPAAQRAPGHAVRRAHRRGVRPPGDGRLHARAQAAPPGRRQDARALDRPVLAWSPSSRWAARRSSAASASARWKCGRSRPTARRTRCRRCSR